MTQSVRVPQYLPLTRDKVVGTAVETFGSYERAYRWLTHPTPHWDNLPPIKTVERGDLQKVYDYLLMYKSRLESERRLKATTV